MASSHGLRFFSNPPRLLRSEKIPRKRVASSSLRENSEKTRRVFFAPRKISSDMQALNPAGLSTPAGSKAQRGEPAVCTAREGRRGGVERRQPSKAQERYCRERRRMPAPRRPRKSACAGCSLSSSHAESGIREWPSKCPSFLQGLRTEFSVAAETKPRPHQPTCRPQTT